MTVPAPKDLTITRGDSVDMLVRFKMRDVNGLMSYPVLVAGDVGKAQIRSTADSVAVLAEFTCTNVDQGTTPSGVFLHLTSAQTTSIVATAGVWDFQITFSNGDCKTILAGEVTFIKDITHA